MEATNNIKFLSTNFHVEVGKEIVEVNGLVNAHGATKLRVASKSPASLDSVFGQPLNVCIGRLSLKGSLAKTFAADGASYQIKFRDMDESQRSFLEHLITIEGVHPGWIRKYPRIPVAAAESNNLPAITLCMLRFNGEETIAPVVNFSVGGLRIEVAGAEPLADLQVGSRMTFDLMTTSGDILKEFGGEVRNLTVAEYLDGGKKETNRGVGIGFLAMDANLRKKFYALIRDFCNALLERNSATG